LHVQVKSFPILTMFARERRPRERFDIGFFCWATAYPDPAGMLPSMLEDNTLYPPLMTRPTSVGFSTPGG
jgi:hypothetical protein